MEGHLENNKPTFVGIRDSRHPSISNGDVSVEFQWQADRKNRPHVPMKSEDVKAEVFEKISELTLTSPMRAGIRVIGPLFGPNRPSLLYLLTILLMSLFPSDQLPVV